LKTLKFVIVTTPLLEECEDEIHTPKMGTWESTKTFETSEFDYRGQNTSPWGVPYVIGKLSKRKCWKWARMSYLKICSTSYGKKKGRESNWQFDSRPLKVENWPDPCACKWSSTHRWKALDESYRPHPNPKSEQRVMSSQNGRSPNQDSFGTPPWESRNKKPFGCRCRGETREYYMGEGGGFPQVWAVVNQVNPCCP
jgi:hypothetical protein